MASIKNKQFDVIGKPIPRIESVPKVTGSIKYSDDIMLPGIDGFETLNRLRSFSHVPVIVVSAKGSDADKIRGLDLGADDYTGKPFNPDELVSRIEAVMRRLEPADRRRKLERVCRGGLSIDFEKHQVVVDGEDRYLTRMEWLLLTELTRNEGRLMTYEELLTRVWGPEYRDDIHTLRTWISRLRGKLAGSHEKQSVIRTIPKTGFIMELPSS